MPTPDDPTRRFSNRVEHYARHRPGYPAEIVPWLEAECGLRRNSVVADVGSGTGILSELFLEHGCRVIGIEPNPEMRAAAEQRLAAQSGWTSRAGTAEATGLEAASVDLVTAGQAFHWFDPARARDEFARILRPDGWVVLAWNVRKNDAGLFMEGYEWLLRDFGTDYEAVRELRPDENSIRGWFGRHGFGSHVFAHRQTLDFEGLKGRLISTSYIPAFDHPRYAEMLAATEALFREHQRDGVVELAYDCRVFLGRP